MDEDLGIPEDIDQSTVEIMRANQERLQDLQSRALAASGDEEHRLLSDALATAKRQHALVSEVPGMEPHARRLAPLIEELEHRGY
jgi:hypothetical protein